VPFDGEQKNCGMVVASATRVPCLRSIRIDSTELPPARISAEAANLKLRFTIIL
jgi:hypothetical protein